MSIRWFLGVSLATVMAMLGCGGGADERGLPAGTQPPPTPTYSIHGMAHIGGAIVLAPAPGLAVSVKLGSQVVAATTTDSAGTYAVVVNPLPSGQVYDLEFSGAGFVTATYRGVATTGSRIDLPPVPVIMESYGSGSGEVAGTIVNALDGSGISQMEVKIREGLNIQTGTVVATTRTNEFGTYQFSSLAAGYYTIECQLQGFSTVRFLAVCLGGRATPGQNAATSPQLAFGQWRIVLTWGEKPSDLDSHFTGPSGSGSRFHIDYTNKKYGEVVNLDLDDVTSFGPETTTLLQQVSGKYFFYVHDYTNRETLNKELSASGAKVQLFNSTGLVNTFYVPGNVAGNVWTVFELENSTVKTINTIQYLTDTKSLD